MADDLTELHERVEASRHAIVNLSRDIKKFCDEYIVMSRSSESWAILLNPDDNKITEAIFLKQTNKVPVGILSAAGMITNEIRACLDGLACALAVRNDKTTDNVYFPISRSKTSLQRPRNQRD